MDALHSFSLREHGGKSSIHVADRHSAFHRFRLVHLMVVGEAQRFPMTSPFGSITGKFTWTMKRRNVERRQCRIRMMPSDFRCRVWSLASSSAASFSLLCDSIQCQCVRDHGFGQNPWLTMESFRKFLSVRVMLYVSFAFVFFLLCFDGCGTVGENDFLGKRLSSPEKEAMPETGKCCVLCVSTKKRESSQFAIAYTTNVSVDDCPLLLLLIHFYTEDSRACHCYSSPSPLDGVEGKNWMKNQPQKAKRENGIL